MRSPVACMSSCIVWCVETSSKCHVNLMLFIWFPVSSGGSYGYDTELVHRRIQGDTRHMCDQFGVDGKLYVDVLRTSCLANWPHHHAHQVWCRQKLLITFHLQGLRMILTLCDVDAAISQFCPDVTIFQVWWALGYVQTFNTGLKFVEEK